MDVVDWPKVRESAPGAGPCNLDIRASNTSGTGRAISGAVLRSPSTRVILIGVFSAAMAACSSMTTLTQSDAGEADTIGVQQPDAAPADAAGDGSAGADASSDALACDPTVTYASFGMAFFQKYCGRCHIWDQAAAQEQGDIIVGAGGPGGYMPPGPPSPTDQERQQLASWIACGAP